MSSTVNILRDGAVARLTLNRPDKRNAFNDRLLADLESAIESLRDERQLRVVIVSGAGSAFCAGVDISEMQGIDDREARRRIFTPIATRRTRILARALESLRSLAPPTIAAVNGAAAGGGFSLMLACDFRIVADHAKCWFPEVELGVPLSPTSTRLLMEDVGVARARDIVLRGTRMHASDLADLGIAHQVVAVDQLEAATAALAHELAGLAPQASQVSKLTINAIARGESVLRPEITLPQRSGEGDA